ncbi:MAG TPA: SRPBCC family protein [Solirubrobacteraceae bacterium]|nr:SRPBCC family protein [Solirubrobacteraceae bacterium]
MSLQTFSAEQRIARPLPVVFDFFSRAANLEAITPPWLSFSILGAAPDDVRVGTVIPYRLRLHGVPLIWVSQIEEFEPERVFVDRQLIGPYRQWIHRHEFEADGDGTLIRDIVRYELPLGRLGALVERLFVRRDMRRIFEHRRATIEQQLL